MAQPAFSVETTHGLIDVQPALPTDVATDGPILAAEWSIYPVDLIAKTGLKRIVLYSAQKGDIVLFLKVECPLILPVPVFARALSPFSAVPVFGSRVDHFASRESV